MIPATAVDRAIRVCVLYMYIYIYSLYKSIWLSHVTQQEPLKTDIKDSAFYRIFENFLNTLIK